MRRMFLVFALLTVTIMSSSAASVSRTYSYFPIDGMTLPEIERQLRSRGPRLGGSAQGHPGATSMKFNTQVDYAETERYCKVAGARVSVEADVMLPRWRDRRRAETGLRLIWDTLARDIERHEESHLVIAKNHARMLEENLEALPRRRTCADLAARVSDVTAKVFEKHDAAQKKFDHIERINFESRILRLLEYRVQQIESGRLSP